jgi:hypothetical protein
VTGGPPDRGPRGVSAALRKGQRGAGLCNREDRVQQRRGVDGAGVHNGSMGLKWVVCTDAASVNGIGELGCGRPKPSRMWSLGRASIRDSDDRSEEGMTLSPPPKIDAFRSPSFPAADVSSLRPAAEWIAFPSDRAQPVPRCAGRRWLEVPPCSAGNPGRSEMGMRIYRWKGGRQDLCWRPMERL